MFMIRNPCNYEGHYSIFEDPSCKQHAQATLFGNASDSGFQASRNRGSAAVRRISQQRPSVVTATSPLTANECCSCLLSGFADLSLAAIAVQTTAMHSFAPKSASSFAKTRAIVASTPGKDSYSQHACWNLAPAHARLFHVSAKRKHALMKRHNGSVLVHPHCG